MPEFIGTLASYLPTWTDRPIILAIISVAVFLTVIGLAGFLPVHDAISRRLAPVAAGAPAAPPEAMLRHDRVPGLSGRLGGLLAPKNREKRSQLRDDLARAGYRRPHAVEIYFAVRALIALLLGAAAALWLPLLAPAINYRSHLLLTVAFCGLGFFLPALWLRRRIRQRQEAVRLGFPDALDMILVCVEAGLGLDAAINRAAVEIRHSHPVIADEFDLIAAELRAGKARADVLRDFARRVGLDDISAFVTVLIHSEQFGTSLAEALRVYASEMRTKRLLRAEEKANQLPVKLSMIVVFCTIPSVLLLLAGPAVVNIAKAFSQMGRIH